MSFKDAMKTNVESLARKSMEAGAKGQAKMEAMQAKRRGHGLLHDLGAALYTEQRLGGDAQATQKLMALLDQHAAEHGLDTSPDVPDPTIGTPAPGNRSTAPPSTP
jgi:hypothetical protein